MAVIIDTSCLITLSKIGKLDILEKLFKNVTIPESVMQEFGDRLPGFIKVYRKPLDKKLMQFSLAFLDKGESEVIAMALETNAEGVIIDEKKGRKVAKGLGIKVIGTLGVLALGFKKGIIKDLDAELNAVVSRGFYISNRYLEEIKRQLTDPQKNDKGPR